MPHGGRTIHPRERGTRVPASPPRFPPPGVSGSRPRRGRWDRAVRLVTTRRPRAAPRVLLAVPLSSWKMSAQALCPFRNRGARCAAAEPWGFWTHSECRSLVRFMIRKYFLPFCRSSLRCPDAALRCTKTRKVRFIYAFPSVACTFGVIATKRLEKPTP